LKEKREETKWETLHLKKNIKYEKLNIKEDSIFRVDNSPLDISASLNKGIPIPVTLINTRDCFVYDLYIKETVLNKGKGRENIIKKEYFFRPDAVPDNYRQVV
jgi:hypothetical protein